jgi:hypothetical protein
MVDCSFYRDLGYFESSTFPLSRFKSEKDHYSAILCLNIVVGRAV